MYADEDAQKVIDGIGFTVCLPACPAVRLRRLSASLPTSHCLLSRHRPPG